MRVVTLSDHAAEQVQKAQSARAAAHERVLQTWQAEVDRREATIAERSRALHEAWQVRRLLAAAIGAVRLLSARLSRRPPRPQAVAAGAEEGRFLGGQEGENRVVARLAMLFDDQWVAFKGYFNRAGEMDLFLVGPTAILALEVKYLNGLVHCEGNDWTCDKSDKCGNVVERGRPVRDAKGRAPNQQVNATADALEVQLARRGHGLKVRRVVVLAHDASRLGLVRNPGVDMLAVLADRTFGNQLLDLVQPPSGRADLNVPALEQVVRQDHDFHTQRKTQRATENKPAPTPVPTTESAPAPAPAPAPTAPAPAPAPTAPAQAPALAKPKPVYLVPMTVNEPPPSDLEHRQAKQLHQEIAALYQSQCRDAALERKVRQAISGHLQNGGRGRVLSLAGFGPERAAEDELRRRLIDECRQTVELEDRTITAIVVPLAVRWRTPPGADWSGVQVTEADRSYLSGPSLDISLQIDADKVFLSKRYYEAGPLMSLDARKLRDALLQLAAGEEPEAPGLKPVALMPRPHADWRVVYQFGVAVTPPGEPLDLDAEDTQRSLTGKLDMVAGSVVMETMLATGTRDAAQAHAEGAWTLEEGVRHGRRLQRRHVLESLLAEGRTDAGPMRCWYSADPHNYRIHLLVDWGPVRAEREFSLGFTGQALQEFRALLDAAIAAQVPKGTEIQVTELDLYDYRKQVQACGLSWVGQTPISQGEGAQPANHSARR